MQSTFYTIYKTTNVVNSKFYIGKHQTTDLNDLYLGSGKWLKHAINKYGIENFKKEILFIFDNEDEMNAKEKEIVTEEFVLLETNYNLCAGGQGGWGYINRKLTEKTLAAKRNNLKKVPHSTLIKNGERTGRLMAAQWKLNPASKHITFTQQFNEEMSKRAQAPHVIEKRNKTRVDTKFQQGRRNSQYGTRWIYSIIEKRSMKILKTAPLPDNWIEGRKIKFEMP